MEKIYKYVPFDIELAKKIQSGNIEGKVVTVDGEPIRVLALDINDSHPIVVAVTRPNGNEVVYTCRPTGKYIGDTSTPAYDLVIELIEKFKPFDKVLVRINHDSVWVPRLYSRKCTDGSYAHYCQDGKSYEEIIPYEGNEHLLGTTNSPI